ncbi:MAG: GIY-YIG nuclease family protein [Ignavibacteriae bacterium]|nr:GIY-YIG nuclease family protein [Ignavibacteriota bacterium]
MEITVNIKTSIEEAIRIVNEDSNFILYSESSIVGEKRFGYIYFIYCFVKEKEGEIVYIGKSKGHLLKERLKNHFQKKHPKTGSKLAIIQNEIAKGNKLKLKLLKVTPESFRNTLEEELISHFRPLWNVQK